LKHTCSKRHVICHMCKSLCAARLAFAYACLLSKVPRGLKPSLGGKETEKESIVAAAKARDTLRVMAGLKTAIQDPHERVKEEAAGSRG
jgi:hypothetical protein